MTGEHRFLCIDQRRGDGSEATGLIRFFRHSVHRLFQLEPLAFKVSFRRIAWYPDRLTPDEHPPTIRVGN